MKTGNIAGVVHVKPISNEQMNKLFDNGELGEAESKNPSQLKKTTQFYLGLSFGRRGQEINTNNSVLAKKNPKEVEYFELNRSWLGSLQATKNHHQGGLEDTFCS